MGTITAAGGERGCFLGQVGGPGRALKGQEVAVGDVAMYGGGRMTRVGAGRPRASAGRPQWLGTGARDGRFDAPDLDAPDLEAGLPA
jgi:hypothetical protein